MIKSIGNGKIWAQNSNLSGMLVFFSGLKLSLSLLFISISVPFTPNSTCLSMCWFNVISHYPIYMNYTAIVGWMECNIQIQLIPKEKPFILSWQSCKLANKIFTPALFNKHSTYMQWINKSTLPISLSEKYHRMLSPMHNNLHCSSIFSNQS